jgi:hypothetical protein
MSPLDNTVNNMRLEGMKTLGFGKYYGRSYEEVYTRDFGYCKWCMTISAYTFSMYDFQNYIWKMNHLC